MINTECLLAFIRRSPASNSFQVSEIADFRGDIGCPAEELLPLLLQSSEMHVHLSPLLARLRSFPADLSDFVNLRSVAPITSGDVRILHSDCAELLKTLSKNLLAWQEETIELPPFVRFICECVASPSIELSEAAGQLFCELARASPVEDPVPALLLEAQRHQGADATIALRFGAIICKVAGTNDDLFSRCLSAGAVDMAVSLCRTPDELVQIVALETVENLFNSSEGLQYMIAKEHIQWLIQESCNDDSILSSYALRVASTFFLKLAEITSQSALFAPGSSGLLLQLWGDHKSSLISQFLDAVMAHMDSTSDATRFAALSAISTFASSSLDALSFVAGLSSVSVLETTVFSNLQAAVVSPRVSGSTILEAWGDMLRLKMDIQAAALTSMTAAMLSTQQYCHSDEDYARHAQAMIVILRRVGDVKKAATMDYINSLAKQPIPVGKFAAFEFYRSLAALHKGWGLDLLFGHPQFIDFLMNQATETTYEAKELKYGIVETIVCHPSFEFLSETVVSKLKMIKAQGPHYLPSKMREMQTI